MRWSRLNPGLLVLTLLPQFIGESSGAGGAPAAREVRGQGADGARFQTEIAPFLAKHCFSCHGRGKKRGDVSLDGYKDDDALRKDRVVWENVLEMIRTGEMPPRNRARTPPTAAENESVLKALDEVLSQLDCSGSRDAGRVTLRRLNRAEYDNTIRDLVGVDFTPSADFPNDDVGYGFDNIGDVLSLSPLLLEKYLAAAESILERAIVNDETPTPARRRLGLKLTFRAGESRRGGVVLRSLGAAAAEDFFEEGDYVFRIEASARRVDDEPVRAALRLDGETLKEFVVASGESSPVTIEVRHRLKEGRQRVAIVLINPTEAVDKPKRELFVRGVEAEGPYDPPAAALPESHRRIMAHRPGLPAREAAREIVARFARRAFRRPVRPEEVEKCLVLFDLAGKEGERYEGQVRMALARVLVSPHFLYRVELDPPGVAAGTSYPITEYELASRLSYFLWSSMPDEELLELAAEGRLRSVLEDQVRRMLGDPKSSAFVRNFSGQWLTTRKLAYVAPDPKEFPGFDEELRSAMARESELFFESILREGRSVLDFLDSDYSFVNERLANHYGIEGVKGKEFRRVTLPPGRGGVLTQASILTLTSNPTRTSPVKRGKWVLDQILGTPPPPPPPDVPALPEEKQLSGSLRKVMEVHRENALCASCHQRMDPLGFAFENYDAIGAWRDRDGDFPIDASGVLPGGQSFRGPAELKSILKGKKAQFCRCLAENVLTYALGRGLESYDRCAVDKILAAVERDGDRFSSLVKEVILSEPFQMRTATGEGR